MIFPPKFPTKTAKYAPIPIGAYSIIMLTIFWIILFKLSSNSSVFVSFVLFNAIPNMIDASIRAIILLIFNNSLKFDTVNVFTILSKKSIFSVVIVSDIILVPVINGVILDAVIPKRALIIDVARNTINVVINTFFILFGLFIFPIDMVIFKNMIGITIQVNMFINRSPKGLILFVFSLKIIPIMVPIIILIIR